MTVASKYVAGAMHTPFASLHSGMTQRVTHHSLAHAYRRLARQPRWRTANDRTDVEGRSRGPMTCDCAI